MCFMGVIINYFENCNGGNLQNNYNVITLDEGVTFFLFMIESVQVRKGTVVFRAARCS
jgi:hypothetical protein